MITLGIETSCDETACAVLKDSGTVLSNVISSSLKQHQPFGGVVPEIASRHSLEAIDVVYSQALRQAGVKAGQIDLIAVTQGPGLIGSLFVGVSFAKALSFVLDVPMVGVNHIEAHLAVNFIGKRKPRTYIGVIVSGGHTSILKCIGKRYELLGETIDDAIGEAYDKVAKVLGLGYPGGPVIDRLAQKGNPKAFSFTTPKQKGAYDFSFSGIKTRVLHMFQEHKDKFRSEAYLCDFCASFQETVVRWIVDKTLRACADHRIRTIAIGGGVSANSRLRASFSEQARLHKYKVFLPEPKMTTDNAVMIARLGYEQFRSGRISDYKMAADPSLKIGQETGEE